MALSQQKDAKNDGNSSLLTKMALFGLGSVLCYTYFSKKSPKQMPAETECKSDEELLGVFNQHIPKEDLLDPFDRQRCIQGWKQDIVEKQSCLVLGVGGIGCTVALALARLGVGRIILIDFDKVECSNLNRQILFSLNDVGKLKVNAAKQ